MAQKLQTVPQPRFSHRHVQCDAIHHNVRHQTSQNVARLSAPQNATSHGAPFVGLAQFLGLKIIRFGLYQTHAGPPGDKLLFSQNR